MPTTPDLHSVLRKENIATFTVNGIGAVLTFFYLNAIDPTPTTGQAITGIHRFNLYVFLFVDALTVVLGLWLGHRIEKNIKTWYWKIKSGEKTPAEIPQSVKRDVLNYPLYATMITALMWLLVGLVFLFFNQSLRMLLGILLSGEFLATIPLYFIGELFWRPMIPFFFPDGNLSAVRAFRLPVLGKLMIAFLLIGIVPPSFLVSLSWQRTQLLLTAPDPTVILANLHLLQVFVLVVSILSGIGLAFFITRGIVKPINALHEAMGRVQENDLETRVPVTTNDELGDLSEHFNHMTAGLRQKERLRNLLNLYVSPEVAQEALAHGTKLGGELIECTVLFSDIRDFTTISELLPPEDLIALLNRYMSLMVRVIVENGGMVNKFGGDSLLAVFGTPLNPADNHAAQAVLSAQAMFRALAVFNQGETKAPLIRIGVGIATGPVVVGNVGGRERIEYTVIGDTVNLAARLEDKTKEVAGNTLMSAESYRQASEYLSLPARFLPETRVKGKKEPVGAYALNL